MRIAETFQRILKDKDRAIAAYEQILSKFPNSLYVEQARKRIRLLRGDAG
jgi:outer membrane protein assembly factor BamD (BamD/ComL family)